MQEDYSKFPKWPKQPQEEYIYGTQQGIQATLQSYDKGDVDKNLVWTTDYTQELPVVMKKEGYGALPPTTLCEEFTKIAQNHPDFSALSVKKNGKWETINYKQYYESCKTFGKALIALGVNKQRAVNIIGFNHPRWSISFFGSVFGLYMPVGVYTTNGPDACKYVAEHSDAEVIIVENRVHLEKYLKVWDQLPLLKYVVLYNDNVPDTLPVERRGQVLDWDSFMQTGANYKAPSEDQTIEHRMGMAKPGLCCTLVYTSGTTGNPKGVMLSHDNYSWTARQFVTSQQILNDGTNSLVSFLPLSHVAAQLLDIVGAMVAAIHVYFADATALQGSLVNYLQEIRPTVFFSVPRVWEKIQEKMLNIASQNGFLKTKIATWAKSIGIEGTEAEYKGLKTPFGFGVAKKVIYNNIKKAIGLDKAKWVVVGAAPLSPNIRQYFLSLNIYIINGYGMSESTAPQTMTDPIYFDKLDEAAAKSAGRTVEGTDIIIYNPDKNGDGEICFKGRNRFMGYYKNEDSTRKTIDKYGYLHSGDVGQLDKNGNLTITGRLKELLITAGGENVAPVLIEDQIKEELKFISNAMVVGDNRKYLTVLLTFKHEINKEGLLVPNKILNEAMPHILKTGSTAKTIEELKNCPLIKKEIEEGIQKANAKAISKAQYVQKFAIIDGDFTIDGGHLTPTMKLKRAVVTNMYAPQIESLYTDAKL